MPSKSWEILAKSCYLFWFWCFLQVEDVCEMFLDCNFGASSVCLCGVCSFSRIAKEQRSSGKKPRPVTGNKERKEGGGGGGRRRTGGRKRRKEEGRERGKEERKRREEEEGDGGGKEDHILWHDYRRTLQLSRFVPAI